MGKTLEKFLAVIFMLHITSPENKQIKNILKLHKTREQKKQSKVLIEGFKEFSLATLNKKILKNSIFYYCADFDKENNFQKIKFPKEKIVFLNKTVFKKISFRQNPDGFFLLADRPDTSLNKIKLKEKSILLIAENIEKPGNIGAMARIVDAVGADALILAKTKTDIYNHNIIRNSRGTIFSIQVAQSSNEDLLSFLGKNKIEIFATTPKAKKYYFESKPKNSYALLIGSEHFGLSDFWLKNKQVKKIKIPMRGKIDSLNASVSAGIVLYYFSL